MVIFSPYPLLANLPAILQTLFAFLSFFKCNFHIVELSNYDSGIIRAL